MNNQENTSLGNKLKVYQIIRGISCIFICINHCSFFNKYSLGEIGVEYFMIISGLLTAMNAKDKQLKKNYILNKLKKIIPLYWMFTFLIFFVGIYFPKLFPNLDFSIKSLLCSLLLIPGNTFLLFPGWTLTYFFVFYVIYWIADKCSYKYRDLIVSIFIIVMVAIGQISNIFFKNNLFYLYGHPILLEFVYGIILFYILKKINLSYKFKYLGLILMIFLFFNYNKYLGYRVIFPAILTCFSIICLRKGNYNTKIDNIIELIGNLSFTIYIIHPLIIRPCDKVLFNLIGKYNILYFIGIIIAIVLTVIISYFLQMITEKLKCKKVYRYK